MSPSDDNLISASNLPEPTASEMQQLALRIEQLIGLARRLDEENRLLKNEAAQLSAERSQLFERNQQARSRIESMIVRLKALETSA
jgi:cell division protein ZapB